MYVSAQQPVYSLAETWSFTGTSKLATVPVTTLAEGTFIGNSIGTLVATGTGTRTYLEERTAIATKIGSLIATGTDTESDTLCIPATSMELQVT